MKPDFHWTPRYILDRVSLAVHERLNPGNPWLTRSAVQMLDSWLKAADVGLEFGSGRSTIWFASRVRNLISVEDDPKWFAIVKGRLHEQGLLHKVDYRLCEDPSAYAAVPGSLPERSLDFCLVDGSHRDRCALSSLPKLKCGGLLVVDNANWLLPSRSRSPGSRRNDCETEGWLQFTGLVSDWRCIWTSNGVSDTAFWIKPCPGG